MRGAPSGNGGRSRRARTLVPGEGADTRHACSRRPEGSERSGPRTGGGNNGCTLRGATGEESYPVGARPRPAPLLRGTERLFDGRILAARRLAGALIGEMKFSYAMSVLSSFFPQFQR